MNEYYSKVRRNCDKSGQHLLDRDVVELVPQEHNEVKQKNIKRSGKGLRYL